jgi:hypothetical protein
MAVDEKIRDKGLILDTWKVQQKTNSSGAKDFRDVEKA